MKWFLTACLLTCVVAFGFASCGPQKDFCPTSNPDPNDFTCHENNDATVTGTGGQSQGMCDGASPIVCSNGIQVCKQADCP